MTNFCVSEEREFVVLELIPYFLPTYCVTNPDENLIVCGSYCLMLLCIDCKPVAVQMKSLGSCQTVLNRHKQHIEAEKSKTGVTPN